MFFNEPTLLQQVMKAETQTFLKQTKQRFQNLDVGLFEKGNVVYKIPFKRTAISTLLEGNTATCVNLTEDTPNSEGSEFLKLIADKFLNVSTKAPFKECMQLIHTYYKKAGNNMYGALLRDVDNPDIIINPFHVLTALSILDNPSYLNRKYNILMYFYPNRKRQDRIYKSSLADKSLIDKNINALMQTYPSKIFTNYIVEHTTSLDNDGNLSIVYREQKHPDEVQDETYFIVTHQLLTKGIIAPFYGTSLIQRIDNSSTSGIPLSPFVSCNFSGDVYTSSDPNQNIVTRNICTGNEDKHTIEGLRTLTHSNLSSAYNPEHLRPGFLPYADAMIEKTTQLYLMAGIIQPIIERDPMKDFTDTELATTSLSEFVKLRQNTKCPIPLTKLQAQYKAMLEVRATQETQPKLRVFYDFNNVAIQAGERLVYTNNKSKREVKGVLVSTTETEVTIRQFKNNRLVTHKLENITLHDSIILRDQRIYVSDEVTFTHKHRGTITHVINGFDGTQVKLRDAAYRFKYTNITNLQIRG